MKMTYGLKLPALAAVLLNGCAVDTQEPEEPIPAPVIRQPALHLAPEISLPETLSQSEQEAVNLAKVMLVERLGESSGSIELVGLEPRQWSDTSLGCRSRGVSYAQVIIPGYRIILKTRDRSYDLRTGGGNAIECAQVTPATRLVRQIPGGDVARLVQRAKIDLARQINVPVNDVQMTSIRPTAWPDTSLGCAETGQEQRPVETRGFIITLMVDRRTYHYHTDLQRVFPCPPIARE